MKFEIWIDGEKAETVEAESFSTSLIPSRHLTGEYQKTIDVVSQVKEPREKYVCGENDLLPGLVIPADDGKRAVWTGYWSKDDGFTTTDEANKAMIEYLF